MLNLIKKMFGTRNERVLRKFRKQVVLINALESTYVALSDDDLRAKTDEFKQRIAAGSTLDSLLVEAFAVVREAARRTLSMRHFDVQLLGGMVLHYGNVAEMRTGEGKTLVSTLAVYLNALMGRGVHLVTVNDYLAERDAKWMEPVYNFLGMEVGINLPTMSHEEKQAAYAKDITYGTNNEFGFDYLRDNMVFSLDQQVQRPLFYAVIDEVDSILIDEARTPLIISGHADQSSDLYEKVNALIPQLTLQTFDEEAHPDEEVPEDERGDYTVDEKNRQAFLTEQGHQRVESILEQMGILGQGESLYDVKNIMIMHYVNAALRAHALYTVDVDYVVKDKQVIIVDEHTGRLMDGRRWSEGLHQAVEAKEGVPIQLENQTMATITFQNYFRLYQKLSGMTGTADTEAFELQKIYDLEVVVVPTNKPTIRKDHSDKVYLNRTGKNKAIIADIRECQTRLQPVLVGTASIESSEMLSALLHKEKIPHEVLNAKQHEREAKIIEQAGALGSITIATNMAGRGTDIVLGGSLQAQLDALVDPTQEDIDRVQAKWKEDHAKVIAAGGLHVLGTERHESRRIDNQLRGRSGRQGDAGSSQFYLSMEDNLLRIFSGERMSGMMRKLGLEEDDVIQHTWITKSIENAQRRVEGMNFDIRKRLLEFDDVANDQRKVVYQQRDQLLEVDDVINTVNEFRSEVIDDLVLMYLPADALEPEWDVVGLESQLLQDFGLKLDVRAWFATDESLQPEDLSVHIHDLVLAQYVEKEKQVGAEQMRELEKNLLLQLLDTHWKDHLAAMDHLRQGIHLRGYAQKNPTQEFKRESFEMFTQMMESLKSTYISTLSRIQLVDNDQMPMQSAPMQMTYQHEDMSHLSTSNPKMPAADASVEEHAPFVRQGPKIGRNDPCHCGSGKKFKHCCGKIV